MQTAAFQEIKLFVNAFLNIMETLTSDVDLNVFKTVIVQEILLVSTTNAKTHVLELVELKQSVQFLTIFHLVLVLREQLEMLSNTAKRFVQSKSHWKLIHAIHHLAKQEQFVDEAEALLFVNVFLVISVIRIKEVVSPNAPSTRIALSRKLVPTTNVLIHAKEIFADTMLNVQQSITRQYARVWKKWLEILSSNASYNHKIQLTHVILHHVHKMEFVELSTELHPVHILNVCKTKTAPRPKHVSIRNAAIHVMPLVE
jgi:hypothetical protein